MAERLEAGGVGSEGGDQHPALLPLDHVVEAFADSELGPRGGLLEDVGRIADQSEHAGIADRAQLGLGRGIAQLGGVVELPVAGVEDAAIGRVDEERVALGDRMGERHVAEAERPEPEVAAEIDRVENDVLEQPLLLELARDQPGGERRRVERHAQIVAEIGDCADMVLMAVGEDDAEQVGAALLDEGEVGQDQLHARIERVGEGQAEIDHHPLALAAVEIDVHADLARAAEREEEEFLAGFHDVPILTRVRSAHRASPGPGWSDRLRSRRKCRCGCRTRRRGRRWRRW